MISFSLTGLSSLVDDLKKQAAAVDKATDSATYILASEIMTKAKTIAPMDTGTLAASGYVTLPERGVCELGFGGPAEPYAMRQHEETGWHHAEPGRQAKYLEQPFNELAPQLSERIANAVSAAMANPSAVVPMVSGHAQAPAASTGGRATSNRTGTAKGSANRSGGGRRKSTNVKAKIRSKTRGHK